MERYHIDYTLGYDIQKECGEVGFYVCDVQAGWSDVVARFVEEDRAIEYCRIMNEINTDGTD